MFENSPLQGQTKEEIIEPPLFLHSWKIFFFEAFLFSLTLGLGIVIAFKLNKILKIQEIPLEPISLWQFLFYFLFIILFILSLAFLGKRFEKRKNLIFKIIFILATALGGLISLGIWLPDILTFAIVGILLFWWLKKPLVIIHNLVIILGIAGLGGLLGLRISPLVVVSLLIIFSVYDYIAVYKTKHMIKMAKEMIEAGAILALIVPQTISDFKAELKEVRAGGKFLILGGGDVAFPLLLCVSLIPAGILNSAIIAIFALFGLLASFWLFISSTLL